MSGLEHSGREAGPIMTECKALFDAELSGKELSYVDCRLKTLLTNSEHYRNALADAQQNARSRASREIAAELEREDEAAERFQRKMFPNILLGGDMSEDDLNVAALYVEYLANRAEHSIDQAWIAACRLKLLSRDKSENP